MTQSSNQFSDSLMNDVDRGRKGLNDGLPNGFTTLNEYIFNTQVGNYYLIGGDSGTYKSTLTDYSFVFAPYLYSKEQGRKLKITYFSFEIGRSIKRASWASKILYRSTGTRLPINELLSRGNHTLSEAKRKEVEGISGQVEEMMNDIDFIYESMTPTNIYKYLYAEAEKRGTFIYGTYYDSDHVEKKRILRYEPKDSDEPWIIVIDHMALIDEEPGLSLKQNIDKLSKFLVFMRNMCSCIVVPIQQFNSELGSIERQKYKKSALAPQKSDFGDSKYTFRDADMVFGILKPVQFDMTEYAGWNIERMGDYAIWLFLMKNRYGPTNKRFGLIPDPVGGLFHELPKNQLMEDQFYEITDKLYEEENNFKQTINKQLK